MLSQIDIPKDLTNNNISFIFQYLDAEFNPIILESQLHGMHTKLYLSAYIYYKSI